MDGTDWTGGAGDVGGSPGGFDSADGVGGAYGAAGAYDEYGAEDMGGADGAVFRPTHVTPLDGLQTWANPDPAEPSAWLDALLPVQVVDGSGDWARVLCANGWSAWVDGRLLIALPDSPPGTARPMARTSDPRPLLARLERALAAYRQLVEQLADGRIDLETFRQRSAGQRLGVVVDGESAWLLDLEHDRWWYCHATQLQTFVTVEAPPDVHGAGDVAPMEEPPGVPGVPGVPSGAARGRGGEP